MPNDAMPAAAIAPVWTRVELSEAADRDIFETELASFAGALHARSLFHDLRWLLDAEDRGPDDVRIYALREGEHLRAYAPFVLQPWSMRFRVGELTIGSVHVERLHINGGPIVAAGACEEEAAAIIIDLLGMLAPQLGSRQAIYLEGVCLGSAVERALTGGVVRSLYHVLEPTARYERRLIQFPASYDEYMQSRKSQTRKNLRNTQHKLERHLDGNVRLVCCADASEVPEFVRRAVAISRKTYQWNLLGLGLRDSAKLENTLAAMAKHGWTRCYLLECSGTATAFMIGYLYEGTYYYVDVGFDPEWEKWSVGTVLHLEVLRDLMDRCNGARSFDFSSGSGVHKKRFANDARAEANYLLLPKSVRNRLLTAGYRITDAVGSGAVRVLDALGIKTVVKKMVRRHATDAAGD